MKLNKLVLASVAASFMAVGLSFADEKKMETKKVECTDKDGKVIAADAAGKCPAGSMEKKTEHKEETKKK